jgi:hypothetical protein
MPPRNAGGPPERAPRTHLAAAPPPPSTRTPKRMVTREAACPWLRGAGRTGDLAVLAIVLRVHPPGKCPAARRGRAA